MKKYLDRILIFIVTLILVACIATSSFAWSLVGTLGAPPAGGGCAGTVVDSQTAARTGGSLLFRFTNSDWWSTQFQASESYTACKVGIWLSKPAGTTPPMNMTAYIYDDNAGMPGSLVGTACETLAASTVPETTAAEIVFTGCSANLTAGNYYHVVIFGSAVDSTNYVGWDYTTAAGALIWSDDNGTGTWNSGGANRQGMFRVYK